MQTKLVNNHDSMRLDVYADGDKKTFVRFGFSRSSIRLAVQGNVGVQNAVLNMLAQHFDAFMHEKGTGQTYGQRFEELQKRCEAAENFKQVMLVFAKQTA